MLDVASAGWQLVRARGQPFAAVNFTLLVMLGRRNKKPPFLKATLPLAGPGTEGHRPASRHLPAPNDWTASRAFLFCALPVISTESHSLVPDGDLAFFFCDCRFSPFFSLMISDCYFVLHYIHCCRKTIIMKSFK